MEIRETELDSDIEIGTMPMVMSESGWANNDWWNSYFVDRAMVGNIILVGKICSLTSVKELNNKRELTFIKNNITNDIESILFRKTLISLIS